MLWSFYGFRYRAIANEAVPPVSVADYIRENGRPEMVNSTPAKVTDLVSRTGLRPESYVLGMADVIAWGSRNSFIFGRAYPTGRWFYFPLSVLVKSSIALLILLPAGLAFLWFTRDKRRELMFLLFPAIAFFLVASSSSFTTGVRHIMPVYPALIIVAASGAVGLCRRFQVLKYALAALLLASALSTLRAAPNYLAYANEFWGGFENTHRIFLDSNTETGQSMKLVADYLKREGIEDCWTASFVHPELIKSVQPCRPMPSGLRILVSRELIEPVPPIIEGTVVLSVSELPPRGGDEYVPIARTEPIAFIGGTNYVYRGRFEVPLAAAISRVHRANYFLRAKDAAHAVEEAQQAVDLASDDPRPHLALGTSFARLGRPDDARSELETARQIAAADTRFRNVEVSAQQELSKLR